MKRILHYFAALMCILACNPDGLDSDKNNNELPDLSEYGEFQLAENVSFMTEEKTDMFSLVTNDQITIPLSVAEEKVPETGTVIVCPITEKTPSGLLAKVVSVRKTASEYVLSISPAMLNEAFAELHIESTFDASSYIEHAVDKEGNIIIPESISSEIWDEFAKTPEDTTFTIPTKASGSAETTLSNKFPIQNDIFQGYLFANMTLAVSIDISKKSLNKFEISLTKQTGISGDLIIAGIETELEWEIADIEFKFRPFLIPSTPIVISPSLYVEESFKAEGKIEVKAGLRYYAENQLYQFTFNDGEAKYDSERLKGDNYMKFKAVSAESELELSTTAGGKFAIFDDSIIAFGMELTASDTFRMSNEISMNDENLFIDNPEVEVVPSLEASLYCESYLFRFVPEAENGKLSYERDFGLPSYKLTTLPKFSGIQKNEAGGKLKIAADVENKCFLECSEEGFALFENGNDEPVSHLSFKVKGSSTKAIVSEEVVFDLPSSEKSYTALPYVIADGNYYYGEDDRWVDLGLPSGILWAKYNVGATSPEEYGGYYAWGETEEKSSYTWENYLYYSQTTDIFDNIGLDISSSNYDVAHVKWGDGARMPRIEELREILTKCKWEKGLYNGCIGYYCTGPNSNSIFIPFARIKAIYSEDIYAGDQYAYLRSSNISPESGDGPGCSWWAYGLFISDYVTDILEGYLERPAGTTIRPVKDKKEFD